MPATVRKSVCNLMDDQPQIFSSVRLVEIKHLLMHLFSYLFPKEGTWSARNMLLGLMQFPKNIRLGSLISIIHLLGTSQCRHCVFSEAAAWCIPRRLETSTLGTARAGGPLVINGGSTQDKSPYKQVTGTITPISGDRTLLVTGRDPPCTNGAIWA